MTTIPPVITVGSTVRLHLTGQPMTVAKTLIRDDDGALSATLELRPATDYARPSPPTSRPSPMGGAGCACTQHKCPTIHDLACPRYTQEDHAWVLSHWTDARDGQSPTYDEALAAVKQTAELRSRYAVPSEYVTVSLPARTTTELLDDVGEALRDALHAQADLKARHLAGQRCGTCRECRGLMADNRCRHERIMIDRDALRRIWCHVQAISPAALDPMGAHIYGLLLGELGNLAAQAGIK